MAPKKVLLGYFSHDQVTRLVHELHERRNKSKTTREYTGWSKLMASVESLRMKRVPREWPW